MYNLIICGFDKEETERRIDLYEATCEYKYISTMYVANNVWKSDSTICFVVADNRDSYPIILLGQADEIIAKSPNDALTVFDYLKNEGKIQIVNIPKSQMGEKYPQERAFEYLKKQNEEGYIGTLLY